ncbi:MAG: nuclear transport factor 2 family protein [Nitrospirota bacterium]|nr:nuclear transport factor 2 family protein [Nitrospirota bacterium]
MSKKSIALLVLIILIPITIYFLWLTDESRIKKLFKEGSQAIEKKDIDGVMSKVSFNYRDEYGLTYLYIKEYMKRFFHQVSDVKIEYENLKITISDKSATADMDVRVIATIGNDTGYILGDLPRPVHVRFILEKEKVKWLILKTEGLPFKY